MLRTRVAAAPESFTAGYSQGGHAALAAADYLDEYAPEIDLRGAIGFGSTNSVETLWREAGFYPPSIVYTYMQIYGRARIRPERILQPQWLDSLEQDVMSECVFEFQFTYPYDVRGVFTERFYNALMNRNLGAEFPEIKQILDENETGLTGHGLPVLMVQGNQDIIVTNPAQREYVERLRASGSDVIFSEMEGVRHRQTRPAGFVQSVEFIFSLTD
jgi:acetyl esterase/lipase